MKDGNVYAGGGATQTSGGKRYTTASGSFGVGGDASGSSSSYGSGGGGRWLVWRTVGAAIYNSKNFGGGGGSGFVWTSSTASNVPSGYSVATKYYLSDAVTCAGNTSFTSTSGGTETGHSGDGYAKITLVSATVETTTEVTKEATRWINIEKQIANGTFTGTFNYNECIITETDSAYNVLIHSGT